MTKKITSVYLLLLLLLTISCNMISQLDSHPEVPFLSEIIDNDSIIQKIPDTEFHSISFLKSDKILLFPNYFYPSDSNKWLKLIDTNNKIYLKLEYDKTFPIFIDSIGNLIYKNKKWIQPDYTNNVPFKTKSFNDLTADKEYEKYYNYAQEKSSLYQKVNTYGICRGRVDKFDKSTIAKQVSTSKISWKNVYLHYYKVGDLKFKSYLTINKTKINGEYLMDDSSNGLFRVRNP